MEYDPRIIVIDFDRIEKKNKDPNFNEEISIKSRLMNVKNPMGNDNRNYRMNRNSALKSLQRYVFRQEIALCFEVLYGGEDYTDSYSSHYGGDLKLLKKEGIQSCITGSRNLQLTLTLQEE